MTDTEMPVTGQETGTVPAPENERAPLIPCCRQNAEELGEGWLYDVFFGETGETPPEEG